MTGFEAVPGGGAAVALDEVEISILRSLAVQLLELVGPGDEPADGGGHDPLEALDAMFAEGPTEPPSDPALARLFPDAYGGPGRKLSAREEEEARTYSAEFRRYTESDLRTRKREDALAVVRSLDELTAAGGPGAVPAPRACARSRSRTPGRRRRPRGSSRRAAASGRPRAGG
ncbi:DUF2017 family protein, partial [Streptomyces sp. NPDC048845]|uniref:DUF2017 family protein n=1 Tax=Streptomyces sp. NPDC048845 TaxID=3155390 RepID=UPI00341DE48B